MNRRTFMQGLAQMVVAIPTLDRLGASYTAPPLVADRVGEVVWNDLSLNMYICTAPNVWRKVSMRDYYSGKGNENGTIRL